MSFPQSLSKASPAARPPPVRLPGDTQKKKLKKKKKFKGKDGLGTQKDQKTGLSANGGEHLSLAWPGPKPTALFSLQKELLNLSHLYKIALTLSSA